MAHRDSLNPPRNLFGVLRPTPAVPGLISSLQAYGGLQAWAARAHRPGQSLGRLGSLEVRLALPLSFLHHYARAPEEWRAQALPERYVEMNRISKESIDPKEALRALPPL